MVHLKAAVWSMLIGLAVTSAFPHSTSRNDNSLTRRDGLLPRENRTVDPAKIERMRKNLGPQEPVEEDEEEPAPKPQTKTKTPAPKPQSKTKAPAPKPTINVKDNSPPPEVYRNSNNGKVPDSMLKGKKKQQPEQDQSQQRKPVTPKRPSPRQPIPDEEEEGEIGVRPAPRKSGKNPRPQGRQQRVPSRQAPAPEDDDGATQSSPQTSRPGGGEKKQKPNSGKPKLPSPGPSKFQNKKSEKMGSPQAQSGGGDEDEYSAPDPRPVPKRQPQVAPQIAQGGPKDRSDGSRPRKAAGTKPVGSKSRKQGPATEDDGFDYDVQGSERAAKDAVQSAGAPRDGPGPSGNRKSNAPRTKNQATAKRPTSQPGAGVTAEANTEDPADQPRANDDGGKDNYFKWFRASEQRPSDFVANNRDGWKTKFPVPEAEIPPPVAAPPPTGIEKIPSNQRQREQEQQEAAQREQNRRASRRENF